MMTQCQLDWLKFDIEGIEKAIKYMDDPVYGPAFARGYLVSLMKGMDERYHEYKNQIETNKRLGIHNVY